MMTVTKNNFLNEFLSFGEEPESEYYPNGVKKPKFRTRKESIANCGRPMGTMFDPLSMTTKTAYEYPCGIVDSDGGRLPICEKCFSYRKRNRTGIFSDRIDRAIARGDTLFVITAKDKKEMARIQKAAIRSGLSYISFPTGIGEERLVISNGDTGGASITPDREIKKMVSDLSGLVTKGRVSGKLGLSDDAIIERDFSVPDVLYIFDNSLVSRDVYGQIEARAIFASSSMSTETKEDISALIEKRQRIIIGMLKGYDKNAMMINRGDKYVQFDELKRNIYIRKMKESGATRMVDPDTKNAMDIIQGELVNFDDSLLEDDDLSSLGIYGD